jgi:ABC-type uncharacterized transport system permease subunit
MSFAAPLAIGAALLAAWFDCRFEKRRPVSPTSRIIHAGLAYILVRIVPVAVEGLATVGEPPWQRLAVVFVLVLPSLVYAFVAGLWLIRTVADIARTVRH